MARNLAYLRITTCLMLVLKLRGPPVTRYSDVFVFCLADTIDDEENDDMTIDDDENDNGNGDDSLLFSRDGSKCLSCIASRVEVTSV